MTSAATGYDKGDALILEPRFVVTRFADGSLRITGEYGVVAGGGTVLLSAEQVRRLAEANA